MISIVYEKFRKSTRKFIMVLPMKEETFLTKILEKLQVLLNLPISAKTGSRLMFDRIGVG